MPHYQFPTNYVYWENIKEHEYLKAKYMPIIDDIEKRKDTPLKNPFNLCDISSTSFCDKNTFLSSDDIDKIIWGPLDNFIEEINTNYQRKIQVKKSIIHSYWFNTYKVGDYQEFHDHNACRELINNEYYYPVFSGIYILNDDAKSSSIIFKSSSILPVPFSITTSSSHNFYTSKESNIKEGSVIIFPCQLEHMVKKCIKPGRRTIAFNVYSQLSI